MRLLAEDIRSFKATGSRTIWNIRQLHYTLPDNSPLGKASQVSGFLGRLATMTGMDKGNDHAFALSDGGEKAAARVVTHEYGSPPSVSVEQPAGTPYGIFRYTTSGMVIEDTAKKIIGKIERPTMGEGHPTHKQVNLFIIRDAEGERIGQLFSPTPEQERASIVSTMIDIDYFLTTGYSMTGSSSVLGDSKFSRYEVELERAAPPALRPFIASLPLAIRFGYHDYTPGLGQKLPEQ